MKNLFRIRYFLAIFILGFSVFILYFSIGNHKNLDIQDRAIASNKSQLTINLNSGINMGGFGDLASNLFMKDKIRELYRNAKINYIIHPYSYEKLKILMPELSALDNQDIININNVNYFLDNGVDIPKADVAINFSGTHSKPAIVESSKVSFSFYEYDEFSENPITDKKVFNNSPSYWLNTGPTNTGIYTSREKVQSKMTDSDFVEKFNQLSDISEGKLSHFSNEMNFGFAYSHNEEAISSYIQSYIEIAKKTHDQNFTLIVKDFPNLLVDNFPENISIVKVNSIPFNLTQELFTRLNLPVLVTGNMSATMAIDNGLIPLYVSFPNGLNKIFSNDLKSILDKKLSGHTSFHPSWSRYLNLVLSLEEPENLASGELKLILSDQKFLSALREAIIQVKKDNSLVEYIKALIDKVVADSNFFNGPNADTFIKNLKENIIKANKNNMSCQSIIKSIL